jgi:hypothetical protein
MPDLDLEPGKYRVRGRKEPILQKGWWIGILVFIGMGLFGVFVLRPIFQWGQPLIRAALFGP